MKAAFKHFVSEPFLVLAVLFGTFLRVYQLTTQILLEDEIHAITALIEKNYIEIAFSFGKSDHCIPLTLIYKFLSQTIGLSEIVMHFPIVIFGIATLIILPLLVTWYIGKPANIVFAWLLAISPMCILYSRFARSYCISTFLAFIGVIAFYKWWIERRRRMVYLYIFCAIIGPYFHMTVLPFLLAPFLLLAGVYIFDRKHEKPISIRQLSVVSMVVFLGLLFLLLGPMLNDTATLADKAINNQKMTAVYPGFTADILRLMIGARNKWIVGISCLLGVQGVFLAVRKKNYFLLYCSYLAIAQLSAIAILSPVGIFIPRVCFRYCFTVVPILFMFITYGFVNLCKDFFPFKGKKSFVNIMSMFFISFLFYLGPLQNIFLVPNQWIPCSLLKGIVTPKDKSENHSLSKFYYYLNSLPPKSVFIVEAPWFFLMDNDINEFYQRTHRQHMGIGFIDEIGNQDRWGEGEFNSNAHGLQYKYFFNLINVDSLIDRHVNFLILHKDLKAEMEKLYVPLLGLFSPYTIQPVIEYATRYFGHPIFDDETIVVFEINRSH